MSLDHIVDTVTGLGHRLVEITGGEPLIQQNTQTLITRLLDAGFQVLLETNGSMSIETVDPRCTRIVDVKCPSSNEASSNYAPNLSLLLPGDEVKFVLADRNDYNWAKHLILSPDLKRISAEKILLSPVLGRLNPQDLVQWMLEDRLKARLSMQIHKLIWAPDQRGV